MKRSIGLGAAIAAGVLALASSASAQEISVRGPLANALSCRHCVQYRVGRFSIAPSFGLSLQDDFQRSFFIGGLAQYHITDWFGIGVYGAGAVSFNSPLADTISRELTASQTSGFNTENIPSAQNFQRQLGQINWMIAPQLTFIPLRGKLALFQNIFIDTDFYLFGGLAIVGVSERRNIDADDAPVGMGSAAVQQFYLNNQIDRAVRVQPTGTLGVGLNFFVVQAFSISIEYRAYPFAYNTMGTDENTTARTCGPVGMSSCAGSPDYTVFRMGATNSGAGGRFKIDDNDRTFKWNQMINLSFTLYLPFKGRVGD